MIINRVTPAGPPLAISYEGFEGRELDDVVALVDVVEITPDAIATLAGGNPRIPSAVIDQIELLSSEVGIVVHGVGLSIGSADVWSEHYLRLLDQIVDRVPLLWHSEHLGYVYVDGQHLGTMLPLPRTQEALDLVSERVLTLRARYGLPFLLENIVRLLPEPTSDYTDAAFLNALVESSGCGLLVDVYNLECDAHNNDLCINAFLDELRLEHVRELHVTCGVEEDGVLLDVHSRLLAPSTIDWARRIIERIPGASPLVTYELLGEAVPVLGIGKICEELRHLRLALAS